MQKIVVRPGESTVIRHHLGDRKVSLVHGNQPMTLLVAETEQERRQLENTPDDSPGGIDQRDDFETEDDFSDE